MKTIIRDKNGEEFNGGPIEHIYEGEGFWVDRDESLDEFMDIEYCKEELGRYVLRQDLSLENDWDEICDQAYEILAAEYEHAVRFRMREIKRIPGGWIEHLLPIIREWRGNDEPLDGDDVDRLCEIIKLKINLHEGNIKEDEYYELIDS